MDYRLSTLWPRANYTADKTEIIDLDLIDPVTRIVVAYEPDNNGSGANATAHPAKCISKIELVDGSDVLYSLTGQEAQAVDFYDRKKQVPNQINYLTGNYSKMLFNLNFGRKLFDKELAFDPTRFRNPQLKISMDIDAGGDESNDGYLTVLAHLFDEKVPAPIGFLMSKEIKDYALGVSSHEYTDLPTDFNYRQLFFRGQKYGTMLQELIDIIKISQDVDRKVPLNHSMLEILANMAQEWPIFQEMILEPTNTTTGEYFYCTPCDKVRFACSQWRQAAQANDQAHYAGAGGRYYHSGEAVNCNVSVLVAGEAPHGVVPLLAPLDDDDINGYDIIGIHSLKLDVLTLAAAAATDTAQVLVQQIRKY